uniref:Reverse transcriptase domain-containing protein n=1 Tax=Bracon brevicornis TaxID=1563983 RepID=A0A6V7LGG0_9HYME
MHRRRKGNRHLLVYWWSEDINKLRAESLRARRQVQRARGKPCFLQLVIVFKKIRRILRKAIGDTKKRCWIELIEEVNNNPWGRPYNVVMSKLNDYQQATCPDQLERIVKVLFPTQEPFEYHVEYEEEEMIPPITHKELMQACTRVGNSKAPGIDHIPNIAPKTAIQTAPQMFLDMYNRCLGEGIFPER